MAGCTWVDRIEFEPIVGEVLHFTVFSGDVQERFCMAGGLVAKTAYEALSNVERAEMAELGAEIIPIRG